MKEYIRELHDQDVVDKMKINAQDYFELVYLRHRYFRKSTNPNPKRLASFEDTIVSVADNVYYKNRHVFFAVGFEVEDLRNIARVHTISFFHLSGLKENPEKMAKFTKRHKEKYGQDSEPDSGDIFRKETYDLLKFLYQRMQEVAKFSMGKNKNIRGTIDKRGYFIGTGKRKPTDYELLQNPELYDFKRISKAKFEKIVKENDAKGKEEFLTKDNQVVRSVFAHGENLSSYDYDELGLNPKNNSMYYADPEQSLMLKEFYIENIYKTK